MDQNTSGNYGFFCNYDLGTYFSEPSSMYFSVLECM